MFWPNFLISSPHPVADQSAEFSADSGKLQCVRMDQMQPGQCGVIRELDLRQDDADQLKAMGICPGRRVWLVRSGDPMIVKVMRSRVGLAAVLAKQVTVEMCSPHRQPPLNKQDAAPQGETQP
jgi:Fe2+ transport system protein FeoA